MTKLDFTILLCTLIIFGFILGWIFPVEGPIDYVYDNAVKQKAPVKIAPKQKPIKEVQIDLDDDGEMETYYFMPFIVEDKENE